MRRKSQDKAPKADPPAATEAQREEIAHPVLRCVGCGRAEVHIYSTSRRGLVTVRYCRCRRCGRLFRTREHASADGVQ